MSKGEIDISNIINVTIASAPLGLKQPNLSTIACFTTELAPNGEDYLIYRNPANVASDFGSTSEVANLAVKIFAQTPNILSNDGHLVVIPMLPSVTIPATAGYEITDQINLQNFRLVDDGSVTIVVDGVSGDYTALDFTGCKTFEAVAGVFNNAFTNASVGCTVTVENSCFKFTSSTTGATSSVNILSNETGTDLTALSYLDTASAVKVQGVSAYSGRERLVDAIKRAEGFTFFNGIITDHDYADETEVLDASDYVQTQSHMLFLPGFGGNCCDDGGLFDRIRSRSNTHTRCLAYFAGDGVSSRAFASAYASRGLSVNFDGSKTAMTMQLKVLAGIEPDAGATQTRYERCEAVGADNYMAFLGLPACSSNGANEFFDNVYNDIWLKTALQVAGFNVLRQVSTKIPQTASGLETIISAYQAVLNQGVKNGCFAPGEWTESITFGDPEILHNSVASVGYYIYATPMAEQSKAERESRVAPYIQMAIKRAGAVHKSNIIVYINN